MREREAIASKIASQITTTTAAAAAAAAAAAPREVCGEGGAPAACLAHE